MVSRRACALLALLLAAPLAGCVDAFDGAVDRVRGTPPPPTPLTLTLSDSVGPGYERAHAFPVEAGARAVTVDVTLEMALEIPIPVAPAEVTFTLLDPQGSPVTDPLTLTPLTTEGTLEVTRFPAFGTYELHVAGLGLSDGERGVRYEADLRVTY